MVIDVSIATVYSEVYFDYFVFFQVFPPEEEDIFVTLVCLF